MQNRRKLPLVILTSTALVFGFGVVMAGDTLPKASLKPLIQACPTDRIQDRMPSTPADSGEQVMPSEYFIYKGYRRELFEFDLDWVKKNCNIKPIVVH